jgi:hypothetical protein
MQGTVAQLVALAIHGNAILRGANISDVNAFYPANSTFTFCESVIFSDRSWDGTQFALTPYANDPIAWLEKLKNEGATSLRIAYGASGQTQVADRMLVGFVGGGGRWLIEAIAHGSDYWEGGWQVGDRGRADRKIWRVNYYRIAKNQPSSNAAPIDLEALKGQLASTLAEITAFARSHKLDSFAICFDSALSRLSSGTPYDGVFHNDIAPPRFLPLSANQLLGAVQAAWVFGGMGSWNDLGTFGEDQQLYDRLSEQLYQLLNRAIIAAANSSAVADGRA